MLLIQALSPTLVHSATPTLSKNPGRSISPPQAMDPSWKRWPINWFGLGRNGQKCFHCLFIALGSLSKKVERTEEQAEEDESKLEPYPEARFCKHLRG
jgi:hypothetical protein